MKLSFFIFLKKYFYKDISDNWFSFLAILEANSYLHSFAKKGAWNDPDMLEVEKILKRNY